MFGIVYLTKVSPDLFLVFRHAFLIWAREPENRAALMDGREGNLEELAERLAEWARLVVEAQGITPAMTVAAREAFDEWMLRWDYLAEGLPSDGDVSELLGSVFRSMFLKMPLARRNFWNSSCRALSSSAITISSSNR